MRARTVVLGATGAALLAAAATAWACVAGIGLRIDRVLVAPGGQLEVSITVAGSPNPKPVALRLDQLDAVPLAVVVPSASGPSVVRVAVPATAGEGQHILIANDERPPARGEHGYLTARALFSVVDARLAAENPTVETTIDFAPPLPYNEFYSQFGAMGADLVRLHYIGKSSTGEFVNRASHPLGTALSTFLAEIGGGQPAVASVIDSVTIRGQVELATLGPVADRVTARRVVGLPPLVPPAATAAPTPAAAVTRATGEDGGGGLPWAAVAVAGALLVSTAVVAARVRVSTGR